MRQMPAVFINHQMTSYVTISLKTDGNLFCHWEKNLCQRARICLTCCITSQIVVGSTCVCMCIMTFVRGRSLDKVLTTIVFIAAVFNQNSFPMFEVHEYRLCTVRRLYKFYSFAKTTHRYRYEAYNKYCDSHFCKTKKNSSLSTGLLVLQADFRPNVSLIL